MGNLNYRFYQMVYRMRSVVLNRIPYAFLANRQYLGDRLQIGVTTYIDRYESFFKPLFRTLIRNFPDVNLLIAVNGFYDKGEQSEYLERIQRELCDSFNPNWSFILHDKPVGLTRLWNEILSQAKTENTVLLNDDLIIAPWFRIWLQNVCTVPYHVTLLNGAWSHFIISKKTLLQAGWFDEDFAGIGFEDIDYTARVDLLKLPIVNLCCPYVNHRDHKPTRTSFDKKSTTIWRPKYSSINEEYFFKKWSISEEDKDVYIEQLNKHVIDNNSTHSPFPDLQLDFTNGKCFPDR